MRTMQPSACKPVKTIHFAHDNAAVVVCRGADGVAAAVKVEGVTALALRSAVQRGVNQILGGADQRPELGEVTTAELLAEIQTRFKNTLLLYIDRNDQFGFVTMGGLFSALGMARRFDQLVASNNIAPVNPENMFSGEPAPSPDEDDENPAAAE